MIKSKPRVLFVDYSSSFGGAPVSLSELLGHMHNVHPIVLTYQRSAFCDRLFADFEHYSRQRFFTFSRKERLRVWLEEWVHSKALQRLAMRGFAAASLVGQQIEVMWLTGFLQRHNIDFMHLNNGLSSEALRAAARTKRSCVVHCRGPLPENRLAQHIERPVKRLIAISTFMEENICEYGFDRSLVDLIHDPIDFSRYEQSASMRNSLRKRYHIAPDDVVVGMIGRVAPWKGQREFLEAFICARAEEPHLKALIIGGPADNGIDYYSGLEERCRAAGVSESVTFVEFVGDIASHYAVCDIVAHASIEPEPFGRVVVEAMAAMRPVIAANSGGPEDLIEQNVTGLLHDPTDAAGYAQCLLRLARDGDLRQTLAEAAYVSARKAFDPESISRKVDQTYVNAALV